MRQLPPDQFANLPDVIGQGILAYIPVEAGVGILAELEIKILDF
jgi:hypothetical protein